MSTDKKISQLSSGAPAQAGDEYVVARSGANYKLTLTNIAASMPPIGASTPNTGAFTDVSASGVASFADGTSSAPAITNTGDTNTGVYFPAADEVAVAAGGSVAAAFNSNGLFFRNRIINGDMRIDQRNAGAAVTTNLAFPVDRFIVTNNTDGAFSAQQDASVPTGGGFVNSVKLTVTTADTSLASTQSYGFLQRIEGTNVADLMWGSASARTVTLSFWARSSLTGTFGGSIRNADVNRSYPFSYSISVADTWEYKTVTIPGDTTGTWLSTNGTAFQVFFALGAGTDRSGTAGAWNSNNNVSTTGAVSVIGTLNATFYITGVQLESGSVATPFERRPFGTELMLCQRYCYSAKDDGGGDNIFAVGQCFSATSAVANVTFPVTMRATPSTLTTTSSFNLWNASGSQVVVSTLSLGAFSSQNIGVISCTTAGSLVAGNVATLYSNSTTSQLTFSAEL
jgi:hypothetical protein